jgi:hypothetical protein
MLPDDRFDKYGNVSTGCNRQAEQRDHFLADHDLSTLTAQSVIGVYVFVICRVQLDQQS